MSSEVSSSELEIISTNKNFTTLNLALFKTSTSELSPVQTGGEGAVRAPGDANDPVGVSFQGCRVGLTFPEFDGVVVRTGGEGAVSAPGDGGDDAVDEGFNDGVGWGTWQSERKDGRDAEARVYSILSRENDERAILKLSVIF